MELYPLDIAIHLVNIVILYLILRLLVYTPVRKFMTQRADRIQAQMDEAAALQAKAAAAKTDYEGKLASADAACGQLLAQGRKESADAAHRAMEQSQLDAKKLLEQAREEADELKARALDDAKTDLTDLAVTMAGRVLRFDDAAKENIKSGTVTLRGEKTGTLKTARPCPKEQVAAITARLEQLLGCHLKLDVLVEPSLLGGYCAYIDGTVYDFSYAAQLDTMKQKLS